MGSLSITNTFTGLTAALASEVNQNFDDVASFVNGSTVHRDGTKPFTADQSMGNNKLTNLASGVAASDAATVGQLGGALPIGFIAMYGAGVAPGGGWLLCDGAAVSRSTYADLFSVIGTAFGAGDGATTFNLPDMVGQFPRGHATPGTVGGQNDWEVVDHEHDIDHNHPSFTSGSNNQTHSHFLNQGAGFGPDGDVDAHDGGTAKTALTSDGAASVGAYETSNATNTHTHTINPPSFSGVSSAVGVDGTAKNIPEYVGLSFIIKAS